MDELKDKTVLVYDEGQYVDLATRLSRDFGRTLYYVPWKDNAPHFERLIVGDGIPGVERVRNFWDVMEEVDLFVFPDCYDADLQLHLESLGKRVWGSRKAEEFEYMRQLFKKTCKEVGLPVNPYKIINGVPDLREYLKDNPDQIIKRSVCRGDSETWDCPAYALREGKLDSLEFLYGPHKHDVEFLVEPRIETVIEVGYDGISIDGQYTDGLVDYEIKNMACISAFQKYADMNETVVQVNEAFSEKLAETRCRSNWGTEIRIDEEGTGFFIDATCRVPWPPGATWWEMAKNLSEIFWYGAEGIFTQVKPAAAFGVEFLLYTNWEDQSWQPLKIPESIRKWVKLSCFCQVDDLFYPIAFEGKEHLAWAREQVGSVVGLGNTIEEALLLAKERAEQIEGFKLDYDLSAAAEALQRIKAGQEEGVAFGNKPIPEPSIVTED